jgi:hypothetical protein
MAVSIEHSIGVGGSNRPKDVRAIQDALNKIPSAAGGATKRLAVDGLCGHDTRAAIMRFQLAQFKWAVGRVDAGGVTVKRISSLLTPGAPKSHAPQLSPGDIRALCQFGPIYQSEVQLERERYALSAGVKLGAVVGILGEVFVRHHKSDTHVATRNEVLYDGTRVITKESSCATLHINLGGDIVMREDSIVVIHSQEWAKTKINWVDTCLESGALRSRLGELAGHGGGSD